MRVIVPLVIGIVVLVLLVALAIAGSRMWTQASVNSARAKEARKALKLARHNASQARSNAYLAVSDLDKIEQVAPHVSMTANMIDSGSASALRKEWQEVLRLSDEATRSIRRLSSKPERYGSEAVRDIDGYREIEAEFRAALSMIRTARDRIDAIADKCDTLRRLDG